MSWRDKDYPIINFLKEVVDDGKTLVVKDDDNSPMAVIMPHDEYQKLKLQVLAFNETTPAENLK